MANPNLNTTTILIGITVLVSWLAWSNAQRMAALIMNPWMIRTRHQYYRFLTSGFIHRDMGHLFFNMFSFYFFGNVIERDFHSLFGDMGIAYYVVMYCLAIVVSDVPTYFKQQHNPAYNSLGASGGVSAVIFAFILLRPLEKIYIFFALPVPGFILGILYLIYSWYEGKKSRDAINHDAHLYGVLFGVLFVIALWPGSIQHFIEEISHFF